MTERDERLDEVTLSALYRRLEAPLYNVVYRWVWHPQEAQDITQEAFVRLWQMRDRVALSTVDALVYRIGLNLASKHRRRAKRWRWLSMDWLQTKADAAPDASQRIEHDERARAVREAIEALPEDLRRVVMLTEFSELTHPQIGESLGIPAGTVGSRRHRALKRLRETLGEEIGHAT